MLLVDEHWYGDLSEKYTHRVLGVVPNRHSLECGMAGNVFQEEGMRKALEEPTNVCAGLALLVSRHFQFDGLYAELLEIIRMYPEKKDGETEI